MNVNVIKRNGVEVEFDSNKILDALKKVDTATGNKIGAAIYKLVDRVSNSCSEFGTAVGIEQIQDLVEDALMDAGYTEQARAYIKYRYEHALSRKGSDLDVKVLAMLEQSNEEIKQENANKNPTILSTQRDYMAGELSRHLTNTYLLPKHIQEAHNEGIIHFHDADYFAMQMHNCCLINLDDMLQNGTIISGTLIEKPHSFATACNIATQVIAQVASCQYGGQTISLAHLAPFVEISRQKIREQLRKELPYLDEGEILRVSELRVKDEIRRGVQTLQYQILTLLTTNGQTPFVSVNMYLSEAKTLGEERDLAMIIKEVLKQRIQGIKNEKGVWITPAFPKLLYVLEEKNALPNSPYYYLTRLAAQCTAKRMVPDYISAKIMKEYKINGNGKGDVYPCIN